MMREETAIMIDHVTKFFGQQKVLEDISLSLPSGRIYGMVGQNGSGKTVLMKCICGFMHPTEGTIRVHGKEIGKETEFAQDIGFIIENPGFLPQFSAYKNLAYLYSVRQKVQKEQLKEIIRLVGLDPEDPKKVGKFSMGMKQRLGIAQAIMEEPSLLLVDEPFNGLDKDGVKEIRKLFLDLRDKGTTILLVSHNREDSDLLCDEVYEMDRGRLEQIR